VIFLDLDALLYIARTTLGTEPEVRDHGLLESALARPQASAFGQEAYPGIHEKAAALLHSLARNHGLVDGNKRLALASTIAFYGLNGMRLTLTNDEAYDLIVDVASGKLDDVPAIASVCKAAPRPVDQRAAAGPREDGPAQIPAGDREDHQRPDRRPDRSRRRQGEVVACGGCHD
jgi:death-on-curing protein